MRNSLVLFVVSICMVNCNSSSTPTTVLWPATAAAPVAEKINKDFEAHGDKRTDEYYWLNERGNPKVMEYLQAENTYFNTMMAGTKPLEEKLYKEMKGRIQQNESSVPYRQNGYWYFVSFQNEKQYPVYYRIKENEKHSPKRGADNLLLDQNAMSQGHAYFDIGGLEVSDDNNVLAYTTDTLARRLYTLRFKNLQTGDLYPEEIRNVAGESLAWSTDNKTVFYIRKNTTTLLAYQVWRHQLGTDPSKDVMVYEEKDNQFYLTLNRSKSRKYISVLSDMNQVSTEFRLLPADQPHGEFFVFQPRQPNFQYYIEHIDDQFYVRTNWNADNFKLMVTPENKTGRDNWKEVIPQREGIYLADLTVFKKYLVLEEVKEGLNQFHVIGRDNKADYIIPQSESVYAIDEENNVDFNSSIFRYRYTSLSTPSTVYDFNLDTKQKEVKKETAVLGGFKKDDYVTELKWATARDGKKVPLSIVYKKGIEKNGNNPLLLYAYGSYGYTNVPEFNSNLISLLDRGFVYAIAHVRGEQKLGREWYDEGHLLKKKNTFFDYIDCAEFLIKEKYTSPKHLYANGRSAGGLLMGAIVNMRPDLWNAVVAEVPFVDVITTMSDPNIPLTTGEYLEWGNPSDSAQYFYMKSYSPYDNVEKKEYPNLLVTTAYHDSQVQYFEPAKWVARLRAMKTDKNVLLFKTDMNTGHGGASGRFDSIKDEAMVFAFLLTLEGINQ